MGTRRLTKGSAKLRTLLNGYQNELVMFEDEMTQIAAGAAGRPDLFKQRAKMEISIRMRKREQVYLRYRRAAEQQLIVEMGLQNVKLKKDKLDKIFSKALKGKDPASYVEDLMQYMDEERAKFDEVRGASAGWAPDGLDVADDEFERQAQQIMDHEEDKHKAKAGEGIRSAFRVPPPADAADPFSEAALSKKRHKELE